MPIVFFGSGEFGVPTLARLAATEKIVGVVTQPDRPAGRGGKQTPTPIAAWAMDHLPGVPLLKPERVDDPEMVRRIRSLAISGPDAPCIVIIAFGQKIPPALIDGIFAINLHASLLPRWRGAAPINAAILAGDDLTGNSVITIAPRMDAGLVLAQSTRPILPDQTAGDLHDALAADGPSLVLDVLRRWRTGDLQPAQQDEQAVTRARKLSKADSWVRFEDDAGACRRRVHGLTPWPGVAVTFRHEQLKLRRVRAESVREPDAAPGTIIDADHGLVACGGESVLRLLEVQPPGKKEMSWTDFANGRHVQNCERLIGRGDG
jgi:methionyl-tRNA formyltransferase